MNHSIGLVVWIMGMFVTPPSLGQPGNNTISVTLMDSLSGAKVAKLSLYTELGGQAEALPDLTLAPSRATKASFSIHTPQFAQFQIGDDYGPLYVQVGDQLQVKIGSRGGQPTVLFSGDGSALNQYLWAASRIQRSGEKGLFDLSLPAAIHRLDSLENALGTFDRSYSKLGTFPQALQTLFRQRHPIRTLALKANIMMARYGGGQDTTLVAPLQQVIQQVPFDQTLLAAHLPDYVVLLDMYLSARLQLNLFTKTTKAEMEARRPRLPLITDQEIKKWTLAPAFKEYLRARNLATWINRQGITQENDSLMVAFRQAYPQSTYRGELQKRYDKWLVIKAGQKAPNFSGTTPDGKTLALSDLKDKVVYIDVWATWCVPCRAELPSSRQLQKTFSQTDKVAFLYVSIDKNQAAWKKMVGADFAPGGYHINWSDQKQVDSFAKSYLVGGVPRYILVDKLGNIANPEAPRPSSKEIEQVIKALVE